MYFSAQLGYIQERMKYYDKITRTGEGNSNITWEILNAQPLQ